MGTLIVFRLEARDASALAKEFAPEFTDADLVSLPAYQVCLKLQVDGTTSRPFTALTLPPPPAGGSHRERIIKESRRRHSRPVAEVEWEIIRTWQAEPSPRQAR